MDPVREFFGRPAANSGAGSDGLSDPAAIGLTMNPSGLGLLKFKENEGDEVSKADKLRPEAGAFSESVVPGEPAKAQQQEIIVGYSLHNDTSPPLRDMKELLIKPDTEGDNEGREASKNPALLNDNIDSTDEVIRSFIEPNAMPTPGLNFDGIPFPGVACNCAPPDTSGEVGATQYVQMVNKGLQVFNKTTGASVLGPVGISTLWGGFGGVCEFNGTGQPIVVYDQLANRWVVSQSAGTPVPNYECVAVSTTNDATGAWYRYAFSLGINLYDGPKLSVWPDAYYLATDVYNTGGTAYLGPQPYALDRSAMLTGNPATFISPGPQSTTLGSMRSGDLDGSILPPAGAPNPWLSTDGTTWPLYRFHVDFVTPANSTWILGGNLAPAGYTELCPTTRSCVPQLGSTANLDGVGDRPMFRLAYRRFADGHEALVGNRSVSSSSVAGIRWWEINNATSGVPSFVQQSTYQPGDGIWRWMGSAAMDTQGNLALGFSASSSSINPQIRYAGRLATDPAGTLAQGEAILFAGTGSQTGTSNRWGSFSDMTVDPVDDCTFWYTNEYYSTTTSFNWRTRIGNFKFPNCSLALNFSLAVTPASREVCAPASATYTVNTTSISGFTDPIALTATGNPVGTTVTFSPNPVTPGNSSTMTVSNTGAGAPGLSTINVLGTSGALTQNQNVTLNLYTASPGTPTLTAPANGATGVAISPTFTWTAASQAKTYTLEVATDAGFTNIVHTGTGITTTTYSGATLSSNTPYFWRVRGVNPCGTGSNSAAFSFTTALVCTATASYTGPAVSIPDNVPAGVNINLPVSGVGAVTDLNFQFDTGGTCNATLGNVNAAMDHTFIGDLVFKLTPPDGSPTVTFQASRGGTRENICLSLLDDDGGFPNISTLTNVTGSPQSGNFSPETTGMFSLLDGESADGTWVLNVSDNAAADTGSMRRFSLIFNTGGTSCAGTPSISGTITYGNAIGNPAPPRFVKNVSVASTAGSPVVGPVITGTPGTYTLTGFGAGSYTIKPTKPGGSNGAITSNDAARIAQGVSGAVPFVSNNQRYAADTTGNGNISSTDASKIAQYVAGLPFSPPNFAGEWRFFTSNLPAFPAGAHPQERTYASVTSSVTGEDYIGILIGETSGNWNPATHPRPAGIVESGKRKVESENGGPERGIEVKLPQAAVSTEKEIVIPVNVQGAADKGIISYEFDLRYDPSVMQPQSDPVDVTGTVSRGLSVVVNPYEPGLLRVVVYGPMPIDENGVLLNLRFVSVGQTGSTSPLTFERIMFNEGEPRVSVADGKVELY